MVLKLDARVPIVWRDPFSLQFGADPARVIVREASPADENLIAALTAGVSRSGLSMIARESGADERDVTRLLATLTPVLEPECTPAVRSTVAIVGSGPTVDGLAEVLAATGLRVAVTRSVSEEHCDLGVAVGHYVLDPEEYGFWLRRDLPHLPVIYGDGAATVGPLIEPGRTPCLYCLEHHRRDADKSWSAVASQLWGRHSAAETPLTAREVIALAARTVVRRLGAGGGPPAMAAAGTSIRLSVDTGEQTRREWMPHPDCGCIALPGETLADAASAAPSGSGSVADWVRPRRAVVAAARA